MANISLTITVSDIAQVLTVYDRVRLFRSVTGINGIYEQLTSGPTDIVLSPGVTQYTYQDHDGDSMYFYRSTYYSSVENISSPPGEPFGSGIDPVLSILSVQDLKDNYLFGIDLSDSKGNPMPDKFFVHYIKSAVRAIEAMLDITILPTTFTNERKDYIQREANQFFWTYLSHKPVMSVQSVRLHVPGATPVVFPSPWIELQETTGIVEVVPQTAIAIQPSAAYTPFYSQFFLTATHRRLPNAIEVDYTAGFAPGQVPPDILDIVGKQSAISPLRAAGNMLLGPGLAGQSIGIDGLSQSVSLTKQGNGAFAAMVSDYQQDIAAQIATIRGRYQGINIRVA